MKTNPQTRLNGLTTIRAFASLHVVFYHMWNYYMPLEHFSWLFNHIINIGYIGVNLFFILSGYILSYVYLTTSKGSSINSFQFWKSRFARIYPVYAFAFIIEIPLVIEHIIQRKDHFRELAIAVLTLGVNLSLIQSWAPVLKWRWNPPSWTLSVEAFFYLLFPVLGLLVWKTFENRKMFPWLTGCFFLLLFPSLILWATNPQGLKETDVQWVYLNPILRIPEFLLGVLLLKWQLTITDSTLNKGKASSILLWIGLIGMIGCFAISNTIPTYVLRSGFFDPTFMCLISGIALSRGSISDILSFPPLVLLGEASYSIYIFQAPILEWFVKLSRIFNVDLVFPGDTNRPFLFIIYLVVLIAFSLFSFKFIESPLREKIRKTTIKMPNWIPQKKL